MKSLLLFWREVLVELGTWCRVSTEEDFKTVFLRFEQEGDEFLTITLPEFGKDLERALDQGQVTPDLFVGFKKRQKLPIFLGGFMELLFNRATGQLLDVKEEDELPLFVDSIFAIRQLTLMFGKIEKECTPERVSKAFNEYIECEQELTAFEKGLTNEDRSAFRHISSSLFREVLVAMDSDVYNNELRPKHGPGSTADRLLGNEKFDQYEWTARLERIFPFGEYAIPNWRYYYLLDRVQFLEPGDERPVRVVHVPKTQKTPRIIAIEPACMQYMQQAISQRLVDYLEADRIGSNRSIIRGMIGFTDQAPNQLLAREGSEDGSLATLDLSEASDRVSWLLVREMLDSFPNLLEGVEATRSTRADVPGHGIVNLTKFASMGSALCFPIEAMVFLTCVFHGICSALNRPMSASLIKEYASRVRVYGDDIIVPVEFATSVKSSLELFGFKVNDRKSFWTGMFRESCGAEFYRGGDVSVTRVRREFPLSRTDVPEILSLVSLRNQLYWQGLWQSSAYLDEMVRDVLPHFPTVQPSSQAVGRHSGLEFESQRQSEALHAPLVKGYVVNSQIPKSPISGEGALLKCLLNEGEPFMDHKHLERQGRPDAVRLKLRWVMPY
jgi:hypothetical protein